MFAIGMQPMPIAYCSPRKKDHWKELTGSYLNVSRIARRLSRDARRFRLLLWRWVAASSQPMPLASIGWLAGAHIAKRIVGRRLITSAILARRVTERLLTPPLFRPPLTHVQETMVASFSCRQEHSSLALQNSRAMSPSTSPQAPSYSAVLMLPTTTPSMLFPSPVTPLWR